MRERRAVTQSRRSHLLAEFASELHQAFPVGNKAACVSMYWSGVWVISSVSPVMVRTLAVMSRRSGAGRPT